MRPNLGEQSGCSRGVVFLEHPDCPEEQAEQSHLNFDKINAKPCAWDGLTHGSVQARYVAPDKKRLRDLGLFSLLQKEKASHRCLSYLWRRWRQTLFTDSFCTEGQAAMVLSCSKKISLFETRKNSSQWGEVSPGPERLWHLHLWRHPKFNQQPWTTSSNLEAGPALSRKPYYRFPRGQLFYNSWI